jgi:SAM-dependent methyltransferase
MDDETSAAGYWEARYADSGSDPVWSGRVNRVLADVAAGLEPGRAVDLGCGEGGDVIWLATQGWDATGDDQSPTAIERARAAAATEGVDARRIRFEVGDLSVWEPAGTFDLVTCSFLHSWQVELPRDEILRRATGFVAPGGLLLIIAHAAAPPWAEQQAHRHPDVHSHQGHAFPTPAADLATLALDADRWEVLVCEQRDRETLGPDGASATLVDSVVLVRRSTDRPTAG